MEHLGPAVSGGSRTAGTAGASACQPHVWVWGTQAMVARKVQGPAPRALETQTTLEPGTLGLKRGRYLQEMGWNGVLPT